MAIEIKSPVFPESVSSGTIASWHKKVGEACSRDDLIVDIETDKVVLEIVAPEDGVITEIVKNEGVEISSQEIIGIFEAGAGLGTVNQTEVAPIKDQPETSNVSSDSPQTSVNISGPATTKMLKEKSLTEDQITGTAKGGRVTKGDVVHHLQNSDTASNSESEPISSSVSNVGERSENRVPMTRLRARIAERLVEAQQTAAMLTTFNEIDMSPIMSIRMEYKVEFEKRHNVKLGFMSFFVKAATEALKRYPIANAFIDGNDIIYHNYQDIGVAVSSNRGLVVPVLRNAQIMSLANIESSIRELGAKAQEGKLSIDDMTGGTFTISNGGVFGSLLSTPIINPPQAAILGMHKIQERPVVVDNAIVIRPVMYLALSYDHRLLDGKDAVSFLVDMKQTLENPIRLVMDL